jgi:hypothetical protein
MTTDYDKISKRIDELGELQQGWYNGDDETFGPSKAAVEIAKELIRGVDIDDALDYYGARCYPIYEGGIEIIFEFGMDYLEVNIYSCEDSPGISVLISSKEDFNECASDHFELDELDKALIYINEELGELVDIYRGYTKEWRLVYVRHQD